MAETGISLRGCAHVPWRNDRSRRSGLRSGDPPRCGNPDRSRAGNDNRGQRRGGALRHTRGRDQGSVMPRHGLRCARQLGGLRHRGRQLGIGGWIRLSIGSIRGKGTVLLGRPLRREKIADQCVLFAHKLQHLGRSWNRHRRSYGVRGRCAAIELILGEKESADRRSPAPPAALRARVCRQDAPAQVLHADPIPGAKFRSIASCLLARIFQTTD